MQNEPELIAKSGDIIYDKDGRPIWQFVQDVQFADPVLPEQLVRLPNRMHPKSDEMVDRTLTSGVKTLMAARMMGLL